MNKFDSYDEKKLNKVHWVLDQVSLYVRIALFRQLPGPNGPVAL